MEKIKKGRKKETIEKKNIIKIERKKLTNKSKRKTYIQTKQNNSSNKIAFEIIH
jgi:hypothetical protein